ncbi:NUDIX hydrolase [Candidatus Hodarchaeum mangrovi]
MTNEIIPIWEGLLEIQRIFWHHNPDKFVPISSETFSKIKINWINQKKKYPNLYDGTILLLNDFILEKDGLSISLKTSPIKFSILNYFVQNDMILPETYGSLGFQVIIKTKESSHLLAGKRSHLSEYKPLFWTVPGGMLEEGDIKQPFINAVIRELSEEIDLPININSFKLSAILPEISGNGVVLILNTLIKYDIDINNPVSGNEEWEDQSLYWITSKELSNLDPKKSMEGLLYLIQKDSVK